MSCHIPAQPIPAGSSIALVGNPNVGKSVIFQKLTGQRVIVSNYPGTTIEITEGLTRTWPDVKLLDTPGVITLPPQSEDEVVTARVLLQEPLRAVVQVGDAKNLRRTLLLTMQLAELGRPMVLALNMKDEANQRGVAIDHVWLANALDIPVVMTTATQGEGIQDLTEALSASLPPRFQINYPHDIEKALASLAAVLPEAPISRRALGLAWLANDPIASDWIQQKCVPTVLSQLNDIRSQIQMAYTYPLAEIIQQQRAQRVDQLARSALAVSEKQRRSPSAILGRLAVHPVWGLAVLGVVLYAIYWFVGIFGAGTLVGLFEENLFGEIINPWIIGLVEGFIPIPWLSSMLVGEYGLWTMGMTYALALILPIVTTFFLAFGILEDSGYLPRLAVLSNRMFTWMGLNGKAVLPMVLGLGCVTMATLTTRILETKRERILVTLLLALAIPCSAQLGVVMGMLAGVSLTATLIWSGVVVGVMLAVGWLAAKVMPGERSALLVELPPMRWPVFSNVMIKTLARLEWYAKEVVPIFLIGTVIMFLLNQFGLLAGLNRMMEPLVTGWLGLPVEASSAFLMGFMRRDFGATGLFVMEAQGLLTASQVVVAMVAITLFIPCVASVFMIAKEHGRKTAAAMTLLVFPLAFLVAGLLQRVLAWVGL